MIEATPPAPRRTSSCQYDWDSPARALLTATTPMPVASSTRSPTALIIRPTNGAIAIRIRANTATTAPAAALPTPNSRANSGRAGATRPKPSATMKPTPVSARTSGGRSRKSRITPPRASERGHARSASARSESRCRPAGSLHGETEAAGDQHPLHLGGALTDLEDLGVAVEPRDGVLLHEAVAAEHLGGDTGRGHGGLGGVELRHRGDLLELARRRARALAHRVLGRGRLVDQ